MKVLMIHPQTKLFGGAELVVVRIAKYLQRKGHKVTILASNKGDNAEYEGLDIITPKKPVDWHLWGIKTLPDIYKVFTRLHDVANRIKGDYDIISAHNFPSMWASPFEKPIVWQLNEIPELVHSERSNTITRAIYTVGKVVDKMIVRDKNPEVVVADKVMHKKFWDRYAFQAIVIPYGIDGDFFANVGVTHRNHKFTIIQPNMISPSKRQLNILEQIKGMDVKVIFTGYAEEGHPYVKKVKQFIKENHIEAEFVTKWDRSVVRHCYGISDIAVFSGVGQGSWLSPFESLASGCPIIVSPDLSCASLINEQQIGIVSNDIKGHVHSYMLGGEYRNMVNRMTEWGHKFTLEKLTWDRFGEAYEAELYSAIGWTLD